MCVSGGGKSIHYCMPPVVLDDGIEHDSDQDEQDDHSRDARCVGRGRGHYVGSRETVFGEEL